MTSLFFLLRHCLTSWRHVMTSRNLPNLSLLVDELERQTFFCFCSFLDREIQWHHYFFCCVIAWRHDVTSWRHTWHYAYLFVTMSLNNKLLCLFHHYYGSKNTNISLILLLQRCLTSRADVMTSKTTWRHDVKRWRNVKTNDVIVFLDTKQCRNKKSLLFLLIYKQR